VEELTMIKIFALIHRKEGISREEFTRHYEESHAPLALKLFPQTKKYVRNHVVDIPGMKAPAFDCISEFWYDSIEDAMAVAEMAQSESGQAIRDDEDKFMDSSQTISFIVDERVSDI